MKTLKYPAMALGAALLAAGPGTARADGLNQIHPGFEMADLQPAGRKLLIGGLDFFSDGRMAACTWGNPGEVWILKDPQQATAATAQFTRFAFGLQQVLGCKVVRDTVYVLQMGELTQLVDTDGDGRADLYNRVNDAFSTSESLLGYAYDVVHFGGSFYAVLSADVGFGGSTFKPPLKDRSSFVRLGRDNTVEYLAAGFRNPNGMGLGFGNRMFSSDNQGQWLPSSKLIHLQKGRFYGHRTEPANRFQDQPETWPLAWLPHGTVSLTPGNVQYLPAGLYKNQLLLAEQDRRISRIYRVSVEEVGGVMQGAVLPFSGGLGTGVSRVALGQGNILYAGLLGGDGGWSNLASMSPGLRRLKPKDISKAAVFEILAVRSTGPATFELEFTKPVEAAANSVAKYSVVTWTFTPQESYGGGNNVNTHQLTVEAATVKPDGRTVELRIAGLAEKYLVNFKLAGLKSADGEASWTPEAWYTLTKFGPGKVPDVAGCKDPKYVEFDPGAVLNDPAACATVGAAPRRVLTEAGNLRIHAGQGGGMLVEGEDPGPWELRLVDAAGRVMAARSGQGPFSWKLESGALPRGLHWLVGRAGGRALVRPMIL